MAGMFFFCWSMSLFFLVDKHKIAPLTVDTLQIRWRKRSPTSSLPKLERPHARFSLAELPPPLFVPITTAVLFYAVNEHSMYALDWMRPPAPVGGPPQTSFMFITVVRP